MASSVPSFRELIGIKPSTVSINDSTLIIIDAQNEYASGKLATVNIQQTRSAIHKLLEKYRNSTHKGRNIVHIVHQTPQGAPVFTADTELFEEFAELKPQDGEKVFTKNFPSSFAKTELDSHLKSLGDVGKKLVLVGYMAHVCVSTTARTASELGYDVVIVSDAVGDRDIPGVKGEVVVETVLKELGDAFGTVLTSDEIEG